MEEDTSQNSVITESSKDHYLLLWGDSSKIKKIKKFLKQKYIYRYFIQVHIKLSLGMSQIKFL